MSQERQITERIPYKEAYSFWKTSVFVLLSKSPKDKSADLR